MKVRAASRIVGRRPSASAIRPPATAPTTAPSSSPLTTAPCRKLESPPKSSLMNNRAPEMTPVSKPNKKPPRAATAARRTTKPPPSVVPRRLNGLSMLGLMGRAPSPGKPDRDDPDAREGSLTREGFSSYARGHFRIRRAEYVKRQSRQNPRTEQGAGADVIPG